MQSIKLIVYIYILEKLWLCRVAALKILPVHPFNALIFPILRDCLQSVCTFLGFWHGNFFLTVPFPDHCLFLPLQFVR